VVPEPSTTCVLCGYNLLGLPSVICPECGCDTVKEAQQERLRRLAKKKVSRHWLLVPAALGLAIAAEQAISSTVSWRDNRDAGLFLICPFLLLWLVIRPKREQPLDWAVQLLLAPILAVTLAWIMSWRAYPRMLDDDMLGTATIGGIVLVTLCWAFARERAIWRPIFGMGVVSLLTGSSLWVFGLSSMIAGNTWSVLGDPRSGQIYDQYPLRNDELLMVLRPWMAIGAVTMIASVWLRRLIARRSSVNPLHQAVP